MKPSSTPNPQDLFYALMPDLVLNAVENCGWLTTGEYLQLNSYENRVFSVRLEEPVGAQVIVKFYRPQRWSERAILEEHFFLEELQQQGVSVIAPLAQTGGTTLSLQHGLWCAVFPKAKGRMPQEFSNADLTRLGRVLARLHNVGSQQRSQARPIYDVEQFAEPALHLVEPLISPVFRDRYLEAAHNILDYLDHELDPRQFQRIHGDCHRGNVLQTDEPGQPPELFLIDFDDFGMGPVAQDFWMLFRRDDEDFGDEIDAFLAGYTELREFNHEDLRLMEPLRGMRIIHYAAWIARRWTDPSFPQLFPQFGSDAYWLDETQALEQVAQRIT
jgi:Ser/Thr protein kinase RdoA (MazF antagonist)